MLIENKRYWEELNRGAREEEQHPAPRDDDWHGEPPSEEQLERHYQTKISELSYVDEGGLHEKAARTLVENKHAKGMVTSLIPELANDRSYTEMLNADLALPAAYMLARRIYLMKESAEGGSQVDIKDSPSSISALTDRLHEIISTEKLVGNSIFGTSEGRELELVVGKMTDQIMDETRLHVNHVFSDDIEILCEALGRLCCHVLERQTQPPGKPQHHKEVQGKVIPPKPLKLSK